MLLHCGYSLFHSLCPHNVMQCLGGSHKCMCYSEECNIREIIVMDFTSLQLAAVVLDVPHILMTAEHYRGHFLAEE